MPQPPDLVLDGQADASALHRGSFTFIGTATALISLGGFSILTDPNFLHQGDHAPLGYGLRSKRLTNPAIELEQLPSVDFVVLSHHHGDHFDPVVVKRLPKDLPIVTERHSARKLSRQGFRRPIAMDTWDTLTITRGDNWIRLTSMPGKHAPQPLQAMLPKVMGSMLEFGTADRVSFRLYITGDTLLHDDLAEIPKRYPDIDLCVIHLGGTRIAGVLLTMDGEQGVRALQLIRPAEAIPVHYDDYTVFRSPLSDFRERAERASLATTIHYLERGETYEFAVAPR